MIAVQILFLRATNIRQDKFIPMGLKSCLE